MPAYPSAEMPATSNHLMLRTYYATPHEDRVTRAALQLERKVLAGREQMQAVCVSAGSLRRSRRRD